MSSARFVIECSDTHVCAAHRGKGGKPSVVRAELPEGTLEGGAVRNPEALAKAMKDLGIPAGTACTLLLPPTCVYATRMDVARTSGQSLQDAITDAAERLIPEPIAQLTLRWKELARTRDTVTVAVLGMRTDTLEAVLGACKAAEIRIATVATAPAAAAALTRAPSCVIVLPDPPVVTVFEQGWPVDEAVLPSSSEFTRLAETFSTMLAEHGKRGFHPAVVTVAAGEEHRQIIDTTLQNTSEKPISASPLDGYESEEGVSPGIFAALRAGGRLRLNLLAPALAPRLRLLGYAAVLATALLALVLALQFRA